MTQPASVVQPLRQNDLAMFDAVLSHFVADAEAHEVLLLKEKGSQVVLNRGTTVGNWGLRGSRLQSDYPEGNLPEEALDDLELRNNGTLSANTPDDSSIKAMLIRQGANIDAFVPTHPEVLIGDFSNFPKPRHQWDVAFEQAYPKAKAFVTMALPGYSADQRQSIVVFGFGPVVNHGEAVYVLEKDSAGKWFVVWKVLRARP